MSEQWWTEEDLGVAADAIHFLWCGEGLSHVAGPCPHYRYSSDGEHTQAAAVLDSLNLIVERIKREAVTEALRAERGVA